MMNRRTFLKSSMLALGGLSSLAFNPLDRRAVELTSERVVRVCINSLSVYARPDDTSKILYQRYRDDLVNVYYDVVSEYGPDYNPLWYRVWNGYIHSAHLQTVKTSLNPIVETIRESGSLAEVTIPYTQTMRYIGYKKAWEPLYRLYYSSLHWVVGLDEGPDGTPWYRLHDELSEIEYHAPAEHFRLVPDSDFAPISPDIPAWEKRIEVSIARQTFTAYENDTVVRTGQVSTGLPDRRNEPGLIPTNTPKGEYNISSKMPSKHMGNGELTSDISAYELPGVPWVSFFVPETGVAFHGTYWHTNFGVTMSRGCVNMKNEDANWVFRWTTPVTPPETWEERGRGTQVIVA